MKRTLLLISVVTATTLASLQHEALAQQPTPLTGSVTTPTVEKAKKNPPPRSGKKTPGKAAESKAPPPPVPPPVSMPLPPMVEIMPMDLPPPASNAPPAPTPPGAGSIASGITPVRYGAPTPGSSRLIASVPVLPPKAPPTVELSVGAPVQAATPVPAQAAAAVAPAVAKVTPYTPPVFSPPMPARKPAQGPTRTVETATPASAVTAPPSGDQSAAAKPGYTAVVPITPFGAAPPQPPAPAFQPAPEPITFTVRLPTIVMLEPKP